jgi:hypothetical protein
MQACISRRRASTHLLLHPPDHHHREQRRRRPPDHHRNSPTPAGDGGPARRHAKRSSQLLRPGSRSGAHDSRAWARGARGGAEGQHSWRWRACMADLADGSPGARLLARLAELVRWADSTLELVCLPAQQSSPTRSSGRSSFTGPAAPWSSLARPPGGARMLGCRGNGDRFRATEIESATLEIDPTGICSRQMRICSERGAEREGISS